MVASPVIPLDGAPKTILFDGPGAAVEIAALLSSDKQVRYRIAWAHAINDAGQILVSAVRLSNAGHLRIQGGQVCRANNGSGHFKPPARCLAYLRDTLQR